MATSQRNVYDAFDRSDGNGSASAEDDLVEKNSIFHNEWGSSAATTFKPSDTDAHGNDLSQKKQQKFEDLYALNNGKWEKSRKIDIHSSHVKNDAETFMSVLEIPTPQRKRVVHILDQVNISANNFGGRQYEKIILSICSLVCDEALSNRYPPTTDEDVTSKRLFNQEEFKELMETVSMSGTEHRKIREKVRQESDYF